MPAREVDALSITSGTARDPGAETRGVTCLRPQSQPPPTHSCPQQVWGLNPGGFAESVC